MKLVEFVRGAVRLKERGRAFRGISGNRRDHRQRRMDLGDLRFVPGRRFFAVSALAPSTT